MQRTQEQESSTWSRWFYSAVSSVFSYSNGTPSQTHQAHVESDCNTLANTGAAPVDDQLMCLSTVYSTNATNQSLFHTDIHLVSPSGSSTLPPEYSLQGIFVPAHVEDWGAFSASLPDSAFPRYKMILPKKSKILALDLDETLVHSTSRSSSDCDYFIEVLVDRSSCLYYVFKRPFVDQFLETVN